MGVNLVLSLLYNVGIAAFIRYGPELAVIYYADRQICSAAPLPVSTGTGRTRRPKSRPVGEVAAWEVFWKRIYFWQLAQCSLKS